LFVFSQEIVDNQKKRYDEEDTVNCPLEHLTADFAFQMSLRFSEKVVSELQMNRDNNPEAG
jgi:hypothetical protein